MEWLKNNQIKVEPPKRPKKLTGTRLAAIFGLNKWTTPFAVWCEITKTYQEPFEDTIYTKAGKAIEPKQIAFMKKAYYMTDTKTPTDIYGADYFNKTYGDFFKDDPIFGGMWDAIMVNKNGDVTSVLEFKTTKRAEDWQGEIPEYYALQAALYAYLLGVDDVIMVASFLSEKDYDHPENYVCTIHNTITRPFKVSERYPHFERDYVKPALKWWKEYVETGLSPVYDEKRDAEILKVLRTNNLSPETDLAELVREAEELKAKLDAHAAEVADDEKRYKVVTDLIKQSAIKQFRDGDKKVAVTGSRFSWEVSRSSTTKINKTALEADGLLKKYSTTEETYRLLPKEIKEES